MASICLRLDERTEKNNMYQVRIRISHGRMSAWHPTGVWVEQKCFKNDSLYDPIDRRAYMYLTKKEQLAVMVRKYDEAVFELTRADCGEETLANMTATELRDYVFGSKQRAKKTARQMVQSRTKRTARQVVQSRSKTTMAAAASDFLDWFQKYGDMRNTANTRKHFEYIWRLLYEYIHVRNMRTLTFTDITYERLTDIKQWIKSTGRGEATRFKAESYIRAAYREGIRMKYVDRSADPFFDYRIEKIPERDIVTVGAAELRRLMDLSLDGHPGLQRSRDMLLASFYLCGANFWDMWQMPRAENGEVAFVRSKVSLKTQKKVHIRVEPELDAILTKYAGTDTLLHFDGDFDNVRRNIIRGAKSLGDMLGFPLGFTVIRRTWATIAGQLECPDRVIDKSMGHMDSTVTGRYYEQYDWSRTAKWNRRIIDHVMQQ